MAVLRDDGYGRRHREADEGRRGRSGRLGVLLACLFVACALLALSRADHVLIRTLRTEAAERLRPLLEIAAVPVTEIRRLADLATSTLERQGEIDRLRIENQQLRQWQARAAQLEERLAHYQKLVNAVPDAGFGFVTTQILSESRGPFVRSALINAGRNQGLRNGFAVVSPEGLVGHLVETGPGASRVLLVTDLNSRIPVSIGPEGTRAVLRGDNGPLPELTFLPLAGRAEPGNEVVTSGQDGVLPQGLRIGKVERDGGRLVVRPYAPLDVLDYVSVLLFEGPSLDLAGSPAPGGRAGRTYTK